MEKIMLSPSLLVADMLNIRAELVEFEKGGADTLHIDMIDSSFGPITGIPHSMIPQLRMATDIPLDIHLMTTRPDLWLPELLPHCGGCYVEIHVEATKEFNWLANEIRKAGARPAAVLNSSTPAIMLKEILPTVDMVNVIPCDAPRTMHLPGLDERIGEKVLEIRRMCELCGRPNITIQCDGGITLGMAKRLIPCGATSFVLGRDAIFKKEKPAGEKLIEFRSLLEI